MKLNYTVSIIIPIINEIISLKKTLLIINKIRIKKEFIIIYSEKLTNKKTLDEIKKIKKKYKDLKLFKQKKPYVGGAIMTGIKKCTKQYIVIMASDLETNPYELKKMIKISQRFPDSIISADRWVSGGKFKNYGLLKFLANFIFQKLLKLFYKNKILDFTFAYRVYPHKALKKNKFYELRHGFALEMLLAPIKRGYKVITVASTWKSRSEGSSSITLLSYISYLRVLFKYL